MTAIRLVPSIGIVTVLYNSNAVLEGFFASLAAQKDVRIRLYVIDNSADDTGTHLSRALADQYGIEARCVFNNANVGVAKGNNQGIEMALADGCEYVLLANNDIEFGPTTIAQLMNALVAMRARVVVPKIMFHGEPERIWYGGGHINAWIMRTPHYGIGSKDLGQFDAQRQVGYAPTCFLLLDAKIFTEVGWMDEQYFVYYDDTDFIWRMAVQNIYIQYVPGAVVLHKVSSSTGGNFSPFSVYYTNRNRIYFIRKNLPIVQKCVAIIYTLITRIPTLICLPKGLSKHMWRGMIDGFKLQYLKTAK